MLLREEPTFKKTYDKDVPYPLKPFFSHIDLFIFKKRVPDNWFWNNHFTKFILVVNILFKSSKFYKLQSVDIKWEGNVQKMRSPVSSPAGVQLCKEKAIEEYALKKAKGKQTMFNPMLSCKYRNI